MIGIHFDETHLDKFCSLRSQFISQKREIEEEYQEPLFGYQIQKMTFSDQNPISMRTTNTASVFSNTTYMFVPAVSDDLVSYLISHKFPFSEGTPKMGNL